MALAASQRRLKEKQAQLEELRQKFREAENEFRSRKELTRGDLWLWRQYRFRLDAEIKECSGIVSRLQDKVEKQRRELVDRSKERELLEKYRDNQKKAFAYAQKKEEQKEFDEIATTRYKNNSM